MKNNIIINEQQLKEIKEYIQIENIKLPEFITDSIRQYKTSLGKHNAFPPEKNIKFEEKILKKRYYELLTNIKKVDGINGDISKKNLIDKLKNLVIKCKEIENSIHKELEKICYEFAFDTFGISYDSLNLECVLNDRVEIKQQIIPIMAEDSFFEDVEHIESLNDEVMKRRLIDSLTQGACIRLSSNYEKILNKIYTLDQRLPELYYNITAINEYLSFVTEKKPTSENVGGVVSVNLTGSEPVIKSEAIIFPTLLFETIKGIMELMSSHGLPEDKQIAEYIISQSDFLLAENWDKRFGVGMWDILMDTINPENMDILPEIFTELVSIPSDNFDKIMREILAGTKKGKRIIEDLVSELKTENKFHEIDKTLSVNSNEEYINPDDLIHNDDEITETDITSAGDYTYDAPAFIDSETADHSNIIGKSIADGLNEEKDYYDFFDIQLEAVSDLLFEFLNDKKKGITRKKWRLIPPEQYKNALIEFVRYGEFVRFPSKYIEQWCEIIVKNTLSIFAGTELCGHSSDFPYDDFLYAIGIDKDNDNYDYFMGNYENCFKYLDDIGFYDWNILPDGSSNLSDYGLEPLYKLLQELEEQVTPEEKIVTINKILDVYHQRGDLVSAFIEGGSKSLRQISN